MNEHIDVQAVVTRAQPCPTCLHTHNTGHRCEEPYPGGGFCTCCFCYEHPR